MTAYKAKRRKARRPPRAPLSEEERAVIRNAGREDARRSRLRQGLPDRIEDPAAIATRRYCCAPRTAPTKPPTATATRQHKRRERWMPHPSAALSRSRAVSEPPVEFRPLAHRPQHHFLSPVRAACAPSFGCTVTGLRLP